MVDALPAVEIEDVVFALDRGDDVWVRRLVTRPPALETGRDGAGRLLAEHRRVRAVPALAEVFASAATLEP